jgi:hypothetical protein
VGVAKVSRFFVHSQPEVHYREKCTPEVCEEAMSEPLPADPEVRAQELLPLLRQAVDEELLALARLLAGTDEAHTFGATEFQARELLLRAGAKAYQTFLAQKKTATGVAPSTVPAAASPPSSSATGRVSR